MFRSSTIIRELALNLAKVIFMLKHSVKLRRYLQGGSNMTGTDFFFVTIIAHHSSNSQTGLNRF